MSRQFGLSLPRSEASEPFFQQFAGTSALQPCRQKTWFITLAFPFFSQCITQFAFGKSSQACCERHIGYIISAHPQGIADPQKLHSYASHDLEINSIKYLGLGANRIQGGGHRNTCAVAAIAHISHPTDANPHQSSGCNLTVPSRQAETSPSGHKVRPVITAAARPPFSASPNRPLTARAPADPMSAHMAGFCVHA